MKGFVQVRLSLLLMDEVICYADTMWAMPSSDPAHERGKNLRDALRGRWFESEDPQVIADFRDALHHITSPGYGGDLAPATARAALRIIEATKAQFACCGGNDETPQQHCTDCPDLNKETA